MMQRFFAPATALMSRMGYARKFAFLAGVSLMAIAVVGGSLYYTLDQTVRLSQRELGGTSLILPISSTILSIQRHRGLSMMLLSGREGGGMRQQCATLAGEADTALKAMEERFPAGSALGETIRGIGKDWAGMHEAAFGMAAEESFDAHTRLIARLLSFMVDIADEHGLTLDQEPDTYYLLDTAVNKLPHAIEHLGQLRAYGAGTLAGKRLSGEQKVRLYTLLAEFGHALDSLRGGLERTGRYNPKMQEVVSSISTDITQTAKHATDLVESDILTGRFTVEPEAFFGMATGSIDRIFAQLRAPILPVAETLVQARLDKAKARLRTAVGIALLLFLVVAWLMGGIYFSIAGSVRSLARSARTFVGGNMDERVKIDTRDELRQVGESFNEMALGFALLLRAQKDLSAHLEERVKERTEELEQSHRKTAHLLYRYMALMQASMDGIHIMDAQGNLLEANDAFCRMLGYTQEEVANLNVVDWDAQWSGEELQGRLTEIIGRSATFETLHRRKDGTLIDVEVCATGVETESGRNLLFAVSRDITERKKIEETLRVAAITFEASDAVMITDADTNILRVNRAFTDITGYEQEEVLGKNTSVMSSGRHDKAFYAEMWQQLLRNGTWSGEIWDRRKNGQIYPKWLSITAIKDERGETTRYVAIFSDITLRKQSEEEIRKLAFYDPLTRLPNRRLFMDRLRSALAVSVRRNDYGALLFVDLDRFKLVNDTLGHEYGDLLLIGVADRIEFCVREVDTVARLGGDEFTVLIEGISTNREDALRKAGLVAEKIREALAQPYQLKEYLHNSSPSIGVSLFHGDGEGGDVLLRNADMAMYQAKESGRNAVRFFDPVKKEI